VIGRVNIMVVKREDSKDKGFRIVIPSSRHKKKLKKMLEDILFYFLLLVLSCGITWVLGMIIK